MSVIAPWLSVRDAAAAVEFYRRAFGATTGGTRRGRWRAPDRGAVRGWSTVLGPARPGPTSRAGPGRAVRLVLTVADPDAAWERALEAGAVELAGMHDEGGWRTGRLIDPSVTNGYSHGPSRESADTRLQRAPHGSMRGRRGCPVDREARSTMSRADRRSTMSITATPSSGCAFPCGVRVRRRQLDVCHDQLMTAEAHPRPAPQRLLLRTSPTRLSDPPVCRRGQLSRSASPRRRRQCAPENTTTGCG